MGTGRQLRKPLQKFQEDQGWPGLGFRCGSGRLGVLGLQIDANGSNMRCERKARIKDGSRFLD